MAERGALRVAVVTNIPTPYRIPVYDLLGDIADFDVRVFYFAEREFNRRWVLQPPRTESVVLRSRTLHWGGRDIHVSHGVWRELGRFRPDVVVTNGFNPALLVGFVWAVTHGAVHVAQTDGTPYHERRLSVLHRIVRRIVSHWSPTTVAASRAGLDLLVQWGARPATRHLSVLAVDNDRFAADPAAERDIDVLISGHLDVLKDPLFAMRVAAAAADRVGRRLRVVLLGDGPLRSAVEAFAAAERARLDVVLPGFQQQDQLPGWYRRARTFLFPSHGDAWGLVVNEAAAAGVPLIVAESAGARELVEQDVSGFVLPHDERVWSDRLVALLTDEPRRSAMGAAAADAVAVYTYSSAALGLEDAIRGALVRHADGWNPASLSRSRADQDAFSARR